MYLSPKFSVINNFEEDFISIMPKYDTEGSIIKSDKYAILKGSKIGNKNIYTKEFERNRIRLCDISGNESLYLYSNGEIKVDKQNNQ